MAHIKQVGTQLALTAALTIGCSGSEEARRAESDAAATDSAAMAATAAASTEMRVSNVMIGKRIGPDNRITEPTFQFAPQDTVYVSVATQGSNGSGTLTAAWRSQNGEIVLKSSEPVPQAGENAQFSLSEPKGLKLGTYKVILFLNDDSVETRVFAVKK